MVKGMQTFDGFLVDHVIAQKIFTIAQTLWMVNSIAVVEAEVIHLVEGIFEVAVSVVEELVLTGMNKSRMATSSSFVAALGAIILRCVASSIKGRLELMVVLVDLQQ